VQYFPKILASTASFTEAATARGSVGGANVPQGNPNGEPDLRERTPNKVGGAVFGTFTFGENDSPSGKAPKLRALSFSEHEGGTTAAGSSPIASSSRKSIFGSISHSLRRGSAWSRKRSSLATPITPTIPGDLEMGQEMSMQQRPPAEQWPRSHGAIMEGSEDSECALDYPGCLVKTYVADQALQAPSPGTRPSTATPDTMTTLAKTEGSGSSTSTDSDDEEKEEDLYHAMLRVQTRESNTRGSVSTIGTMTTPGVRRSSLVVPNTARRPSLVTIGSSGEGRQGRRPSAVAFNLEPQYEDEERERVERLKMT
jgi:hypothetical protein